MDSDHSMSSPTTINTSLHFMELKTNSKMISPTNIKKIISPIVNSSKPKTQPRSLINSKKLKVKTIPMLRKWSKLSMKLIKNSLVSNSTPITLKFIIKDLLKMSVNLIRLNSTKSTICHSTSSPKILQTKNHKMKLRLHHSPTILQSKC